MQSMGKIMKTKLIIMLLSTLFALDATARMDLERIVVIHRSRRCR